jgi:vancomycin resistance protein YoaR
MALPRASAFGQSLAFKKHNDIAAELQMQFEGTSIELTSGDRTATTTLAKLGAELDSEGMTKQLTEYPLWQRLIPFSLIVKHPQLDRLTVRMSGEKMKDIAGTLASQLSYSPTDASFALTDGKLVTTKAKPGKTVTADNVRQTLIESIYAAGKTRVLVAAKTVEPAHTDAYIAEAVDQAKGALARPLTIHVEGKGDFTPTEAERASWLVIKDGDDAAQLGINTEAVTSYIGQVNSKVKTDPTSTVVTLMDGNETARRPGTNGATLDTGSVTSALSTALLGAGVATINAPLHPVAPSLTYNRTYSHSQEGLRAYVAYATSTQNARIVVQQLDGTGWSASGRADESIPSASTYKLFVMMRVFDDINSGKLGWDTPMLDTTAGGCFERTIVPSTNPCAEQWIRQYGRNYLNDYVHDKGFSNGTTFTASDATHSTAGDLAKYLIGLNNGTLVSGNNRSMLLEKMGRQLYRYGIPTGIPDARVEDKVGFLWDYIHDAAIVHKPQGTYVLVIMTKGYSYGYIANVARQIDTILYP